MLAQKANYPLLPIIMLQKQVQGREKGDKSSCYGIIYTIRVPKGKEIIYQPPDIKAKKREGPGISGAFPFVQTIVR
jgi:hypothetical protein